MSHPIDPGKLLRQARVLAGVGAGRGRPSPTNHRRAVSAAYYALYHAITLAAAAHVLPAGASEDEIRRATRWINHKDVRAVSEIVSSCAATTIPISGVPKGLPGRAEPLWLALSAPAGPARASTVPAQLRFVVDAFLTLQAARHSADYDHLADFPKATTIGHVEDAEQAVDYLTQYSNEPAVQRYLAWIIARASAFG